MAAAEGMVILSCFWWSVNALSLGRELAHRRRRYGRSRFVKHTIAPATFVDVRHSYTSMLKHGYRTHNQKVSSISYVYRNNIASDII